jgi:hypothetical protein
MPSTAVLPDPLAAQAMSLAVEVANRLRTVDDADKIDTGCGIALLCDCLDRVLPGGNWAVAAKDHLAQTTIRAEQAGNRAPNLFGGLGMVAFTADQLSRGGKRYQGLLGELDPWIVDAATARARVLAENPTAQPFHVFDTIAGLAGTGGYLLGRSKAGEALRSILVGLVALCGVRDGFPNWHTPFEGMHPKSPIARLFPGGTFNCGLAHGIPGPLATLSLAMTNGVSVAGQGAAIGRVANWLAANRADDEWGPNWPPGIAMPDPDGSVAPPDGPGQDSWCYGSPGIARTLWLAGNAISDERLRSLAVDAICGVYKRSPAARGIDNSPGLCHGVAGLLAVTLRFAHDTGDEVFTRAANRLTGQLVASFEFERRYGFQFIDDDGSYTDDRPGLLDGAAGVALALVAAATGVPPAWDRILLLS